MRHDRTRRAGGPKTALTRHARPHAQGSRARTGVLIAAFSALLSSCDSYITRRSHDEDIHKIEGYTSRFYELVQKNEFDSASALFSKSIKPEDAFGLISSVHNMRGQILSVKTVSTGTIVETKNGHIISVQANVVVDAVYEHGFSKEELAISGNSFSSLQIDGYTFEVK